VLAGLFVARGGTSQPRRSTACFADGGGGVDYAIIRFKIPGFDDLTQLPRVVATIAVGLLLANRVFSPPAEADEGVRLFSEVLALVLAATCTAVPWVGQRLTEASQRRVSTRSGSSQKGCLQTLALDESMPLRERVDMAWATAVLLRLTNADGLAVLRGGEDRRVLCTRGLLRQRRGFSAGSSAILQAVGEGWKPAPCNGYCATRRSLSSFPAGALPMAVLPGDTEAAVVKPLPGGGLLVLWSCLPRAFDRMADRAWITQVAAKISGKAVSGSEDLPEQCFEEEALLDIATGSSDSQASAASRDPFSRYEGNIRFSPSVVGLLGLGAVGSNRLTLLGSPGGLLGVDPSQARADLLAGVLATLLVLQGFLWISETPADPEIQDTGLWEGVEDVLEVAASGDAATELRWTWQALSACTRASSVAVFWRDSCVLRGGLYRTPETGGVPAESGELCREVMSTGKGRYLAQLKSYPAKEQFLGFFPKETQGLVITPMRAAVNAEAEGVLVVGLDAVRGVGKVDQAWLSALAEKLAVSLAEST